MWGTWVSPEMEDLVPTSMYDFMENSGFKHVRCNPDVAPRLTSGGYEDKVDVITPINKLFIGGGEF